MNKKGFVFIETLVVLVLLITSVISLYMVYVSLSADIERRKHYDNIDDLYKTDIIRRKLNLDFVMLLNPEYGVLNFNSSSCDSYMEEGCQTLLNALEVQDIFLILNTSTVDLLNNNGNFKPSFIEYLKTIKSDIEHRLIIVNYKYNNKNYYASLSIDRREYE